MPFTYVPITGIWPGKTGKVVVTAIRCMTNSGHSVLTESQTYILDGSGSVSFRLAATDDPDTYDSGVYAFYLEISGQTPQYFSTVIPRTQSGGLNINQLPWGYSPPVTSAVIDGGTP